MSALGRLALGTSCVMLAVMAAITLFDVIGRNLLGQPLPGATELTELLLVAITFLVYPVVARRRQHIVVDLFDSVTSPAVRRVQDLTGALLGAAVFAALAARLAVLGANAIEYGDVTAFLRIPMSYAFFFMALLAAIAALAFVRSAFDRVPVDAHADATMRPRHD